MMNENKALLGNENEKDFVTNFNLGHKDIVDSVSEGMKVDGNSVVAVHLTTAVYSDFYGKKIYPKSDAYLLFIDETLESLIKKNPYLNHKNEYVQKIFNNSFVKNSGISIKLQGNKYTIHKMGTEFFKNVFKIVELGAGASIYCKSQVEIPKNLRLIKEWGSNTEKFIEYFSKELNVQLAIDNLDDLQKIKSFSNMTIKKIIKSNQKIWELIFIGKHSFEDPFYAQWIYNSEKFRKIKKDEDFNVTTGSGRSKGIYTLVIKP
jgi:hypothetical protein